ncbi:MAG: putative quinol monooxygenase [Myxococcota bacterium]
MDEHTVTVLIHFVTHQERQLQFEALTRAHVETRQKALGCLRAELLQDVDSPDQFTLIEVFASQAAIDAYYESREYNTWHAKVKPWLKVYSGRDQRWRVGGPGDPSANHRALS